jgi:hypothetical protein
VRQHVLSGDLCGLFQGRRLSRLVLSSNLPKSYDFTVSGVAMLRRYTVKCTCSSTHHPKKNHAVDVSLATFRESNLSVSRLTDFAWEQTVFLLSCHVSLCRLKSVVKY